MKMENAELKIIYTSTRHTPYALGLGDLNWDLYCIKEFFYYDIRIEYSRMG